MVEPSYQEPITVCAGDIKGISRLRFNKEVVAKIVVRIGFVFQYRLGLLNESDV